MFSTDSDRQYSETARCPVLTLRMADSATTMQCPSRAVSRYTIVLRACHVMSGTDVAPDDTSVRTAYAILTYATTGSWLCCYQVKQSHVTNNRAPEGISLRTRYAMSSTDLAYAARTDMPQHKHRTKVTSQSVGRKSLLSSERRAKSMPLHLCYAMSGTDLGRAAAIKAGRSFSTGWVKVG
eukprot:3931875-Rhodomonas_salina.2